jgi:hypothetical protein
VAKGVEEGELTALLSHMMQQQEVTPDPHTDKLCSVTNIHTENHILGHGSAAALNVPSSSRPHIELESSLSCPFPTTNLIIPYQ